MTDLFDLKAKLLLHIAPKNIFERRFQQQAALTSITLDLKQKDVNTRADIAKLPFARNTFDVIYCSHVLEHVPDDLVAISELHRVLKPGGWAVLQVPITAKKTLEDPSISDPILCTKLFGQHDHVRRYGLDFKDRLEAMHFQASVYTAEEIVREKHQLVRMGIQVYRKVFYCLKS
jgi:ubiquinone/menaquinone biosynthesis C-methylase UbiE